MVQFLPAPKDPVGESLQRLSQAVGARIGGHFQDKADVSALTESLGISQDQAQAIVKANPELKKVLLQKAIKPKSVLEQLLFDGKTPQEPTSSEGAAFTDEDQGQPSETPTPKQAPTQSKFDPNQPKINDIMALVGSENESDRRVGNSLLKVYEINEKKRIAEARRSGKRETVLDKRNFAEIDELKNKAEAAQSDQIAIDQQLAAIESGNISQARGALIDYFSKTETPAGATMAGLLQDPASKAFTNAKEQLIKNLKKTFGANVSTIEFQNFMALLPQLGEDPEATEFVLSFMKQARDLDQDVYSAGLDMYGDDGFLPPNFIKELNVKKKELFNRFVDNAQQLREEFGIGPSGQKQKFKTQSGEFTREQLEAELRRRGGGI